MVATLSARSLGPYASLMAIKPRPIADVVPRVPRFFVSMATGCVAIGGRTRDPAIQGSPIPAQRSVRGEDGVMDRDGFADFLRARREALTPGDVGLTVGPRRRAPGLRREEVAQLTGMSLDYYSRLERRR